MMWEAAGGGGSVESSSAGGGSARRNPSWRERENNRRRERRRRAIAAKIYAGLRALGNFNLPKHCDNNEVLKALCSEAGWIVEPDGTTYRKGSKKPCQMETGGTSANITPSSSRQPSPIPSYQPSPSLSPTRHVDPSPTHPFAFLLNSIPSNSAPLRISNSAPVTPPLSSPTRRQALNLGKLAEESMSALNVPFFASAPASPARGPRFTPMTIPESEDSSTIDSGQWMNFRAYASGLPAASPTFNLVRPKVARMVPRPVIGAAGVVIREKGKGLELGFEDMGAIKAWEGERIHEVGMDDHLQLTLGGGGNTTH